MISAPIRIIKIFSYIYYRDGQSFDFRNVESVLANLKEVNSAK